MSMGKALTGAAGEHYVAFRLSAMGYAVGFTAPGTKGADLLVTNLETGESITVQVKTMWDAFVPSRKWGPFWKWRVGVSRPRPQKTHLYLFVDLKGDVSKSPDVFVVPSLDLEAPPPDPNKPLLDEYPGDVWCNIYETGKGVYFDRWDVLQKALA